MNALLAWLLPIAQAASLGIQLPYGPIADKNAPAAQTGSVLAAYLNRLLDTMTAIAYPLAFLSLVYTAYVLITSGGKPEAYGTAKKNLVYLLTGVFLIVFALIILRFVISLFKF